MLGLWLSAMRSSHARQSAAWRSSHKRAGKMVLDVDGLGAQRPRASTQAANGTANGTAHGTANGTAHGAPLAVNGDSAGSI